MLGPSGKAPVSASTEPTTVSLCGLKRTEWGVLSQEESFRDRYQVRDGSLLSPPLCLFPTDSSPVPSLSVWTCLYLARPLLTAFLCSLTPPRGLTQQAAGKEQANTEMSHSDHVSVYWGHCPLVWRRRHGVICHVMSEFRNLMLETDTVPEWCDHY